MFTKQLQRMGNAFKHWLARKITRSLCRMRIWIIAVKEIVNAAFGSAGERCMACSVVVAVGEVADTLVGKLIEAADRITIGNGMEEGIFLGPVIRGSHKERTLKYIEIGENEGAILVRDGRKDAAACRRRLFRRTDDF